MYKFVGDVRVGRNELSRIRPRFGRPSWVVWAEGYHHVWVNRGEKGRPRTGDVETEQIVSRMLLATEIELLVEVTTE